MNINKKLPLQGSPLWYKNPSVVPKNPKSSKTLPRACGPFLTLKMFGSNIRLQDRVNQTHICCENMYPPQNKGK